MNDVDLDATLDAVKVAACEAGAHVVKAILSMEDTKLPVAGIPPSETIDLIRAVRPRVVYCLGITFDAEEQILQDLFSEDADRAVLTKSGIKQLVDKWRSRNGQLAQLTCHTVVDGVLHGFILEAYWYSDYESDVEDREEEREHFRSERERKFQKEARDKLAPMVKTLMADPRFSGPKVGNAKRLTLAEALFPDLDARTLDAVVDIAESQHWLVTGR